jgi:hypothetical protein
MHLHHELDKKVAMYFKNQHFKQVKSLFPIPIYKIRNKNLRQPGIEPGSTAWKAAMLTIIPLTPLDN